MDPSDAWAVAGSGPPIVFGLLHAAYAVSDTFTPRHFTPSDDAVRGSMQSTGVVLVDRAGLPGRKPSLWDTWIGFNISHGLGVGGIGLIVAFAALSGDLAAVPWLLPFAVLWAAMWVVVAARFWFLGPVIITVSALLCWCIALEVRKMASRGLRLVAALVALPQLITGIWAVISPATWYDEFPGVGPHLVSAIPPFNDHLATDAGAGLFATALAVVIAAWWGDLAAIRIGLVGFIAFDGLHAYFHVTHASPRLSAGENLYSSGILVFELVVAVVLLVLALRTARDAR
jgi:hypothetical protein